MITGINESKTLTKYISRECKCRFYRKKYNSDQWWNNDKCQCESKKGHVCEKDYVWDPAACNCENRKYLASIMDDTAIECEETKAIPAKFNKKKTTCKTQNSYILLAFLLITIALLIAVSIYCYLIK